MAGDKRHMLVTGPPGSGKTTCIMKIADSIEDKNKCGFYTEEIRESGVRRGFRLVSLDGNEAVLAGTGIKSIHKVGKYGVDVGSFEEFLEDLHLSPESGSFIIIDEIGKMECISEKFRVMVSDALRSDAVLVASVALKGSGLISDIKGRNDVTLFRLSQTNRERVTQEMIDHIRRYCSQ